MKKVLVIILILALATVFFAACKAKDAVEVIDKIVETGESLKTTLSVPANVRVEGGTLTWNPVEHASRYKVSIDGREYYADDFSYVLPNMVDGDHTFKVCALGDDVSYVSSAFSENLVVTFKENAVTRSGYYSQFDDLTKEESFLGYGFDVINSAVFCDRFAKTSYPIFKTDELMKLRLLKVDSKSSYITEIKSSSIKKFMEEWNASANIGANWEGISYGGSVEVEAKYSGGTETTQSKYYHVISIYNQKFYIVMQADLLTYQSILSDGFVRDLYSNMSPADLFNKYGTHFITSAVMGGKINSYYLYTCDEETDFRDASASVSGEFRYLTGKASASASVGNTYRENEKTINIENTLEVIGGGDYGMLNSSEVKENYLAWEKSLDDHASLMGIKDTGSLTSIWSLIDPSKDTGDYYWDYKDGNGSVKVSRAQQLEAYFYQYGINSYNSLMKAAGLPEIVKPTAITNVRVNGELPNDNGYFAVYSGTTNNITFAIEPENAYGAKSIGISTRTSHATLSNDGFGVVIDHDMPGDSVLYVIISAGDLKKTIRLLVTQLYNVELRLNGGQLPDSVQERLRNLSSGTWIETPPTPTREGGYTFKGWFTDTRLTIPYEETSLTSDIFLYAKWEAIRPKVTFDTDFADLEVEPVYTTYQGTISAPAAPKKYGYTFLGWYEDDVYSKEYDFATTLTEDIVLYAKWSLIKYTITFETNGGTPVPDQTTTIKNNFRWVYEPSTQRDFYKFGGWYIDEAYQRRYNNETISADMVDQEGVFHLYAKWNAVQVTVQFVDHDDNTKELKDERGVALASQKTDVTKEFKLPANLPQPVKEGYTLDYWYTYYDNQYLEIAELEDVSFAPQADVTVDVVIEVVAYWKPNRYRLVFVADEQEVESRECAFGESIIPAQAPKSGYDLKWMYGTKEISEDMTMPATDVTLTAEYTIKQYRVTYMIDGNEVGENAVYKFDYGATVTYKQLKDFMTQEEIDEHGEFSGWMYNNSTELPVTMPANDMVIFGSFSDEKYTVTYIVDNETWKNKEVFYKMPAVSFTAETPAKDEYIFTGWTYNGEPVPDTMTMPKENIILRGSFEKVTYELILNKNNGNENRTLAVSYNDFLPSFEPIRRAGYKLTGYYTAEEGGTKIITANGNLISGIMSFSEMDGTWIRKVRTVLYAQWEANSYSVTFDANPPVEASSSVTDLPEEENWTYGKKTKLPAAPKLLGWAFVGWCRDQEGSQMLGKAGTTVTCPDLGENDVVTVYAKWEAIIFTVVYDVNKPDQSSAASVTNPPAGEKHSYDHEGTLSATEPSLTGWNFVGWYDKTGAVKIGEAGGKVILSSLTQIDLETKSVTVKAKWEAKTYQVVYHGNKPQKATESVTGVPADATWTYDANAVLAAKPTLPGWKFVGWYREEDCITKVGDAGQTLLQPNYLTEEPFNLYAKWEQLVFKVYFETNGATQIDSMNVVYDETYAVDQTPTYNDAHSFAGWYADQALTVRFGGTLTKVNNDMTLYAKWDPVPLTVFNDTIRTGNVKIAGSGNYVQNKIQLTDSISSLVGKGYNQIVVHIAYDIAEVDDCYQIIKLYNTYGTYYEDKFSHKGFIGYTGTFIGFIPTSNHADTSWSTYYIDITIDLDKLGENELLFKVQAENAIFRDFLIGTVTAKIDAMP